MLAPADTIGAGPAANRSRGMNVIAAIGQRPPAWATLAQALCERRPVRARYHGHERLLCPHVLGWRAGRPKVLSYQAAGGTSGGALPVTPQQRWRSMFVDEIEDAVITNHPWETADNYLLNSTGIYIVELGIDDSSAVK